MERFRRHCCIAIALAVLAAVSGGTGLAQNPNTSSFPGSAATDSVLYVAANNALTTLSGPITASTTALPVVATAGFLFPTLVSIGPSASEIVAVCSQSGGNTLNVCAGGRGYNGTSAQSFNTGAIVSANIVSWFHNQVSAEIKTVENWLIANPFGTVTSVAVTMPNIFSLSGCTITSSGTCAVSLASETPNQVWASPNGSSGTPGFRQLVTGDIASASLFGTFSQLATFSSSSSATFNYANDCVSLTASGLQNAAIPCGGQSLPAAPFNYAVTVGSGVTGSLATAGSNTLTFSPGCPLGVDPVDFPNKQWTVVSGGFGTAELSQITGGTCAGSGGAGTIIITTANTHTGSWAVSSPTAGIQECIYSSSTYGAGCEFGFGQFTINSPVYLGFNKFIHGQSDSQDGSGSGVQSIIGSVLEVGTLFPPPDALFLFLGPAAIEKLSVKYTQPNSLTLASYTQYGPTFLNTTADKFKIQDVTVENAWTVVQSCASTSYQGFALINVQASFYKYGVDACNQLDSIELDHVRFWNYGQTANQLQVMAQNAIGAHLGNVPDFKMTDVFMYLGMGIIGYPDPYTGFGGGRPTITGTGVHIEPGQWFTGNFATINIGNFYFYADNPNWGVANNGPYATLTEGNLVIDNGVANVTAPGGAMFSLPGTTNIYGYSATISNTTFTSQSTDQTTITAAAPTFNWPLNLNNNHFSKGINVAYANPIVNVGANVYGSIDANHCDPLGTGSGTLVNAPAGANLFQQGNNCPGWGTNFTSTWTALTLLNSWTAYSGGYYSPQYRIGPDGTVHVRGPIANGTQTIGTVLATLPTGYRPSAAVRFTCPNSTTAITAVVGLVDVLANGNIVTGSNLNGISGTPLWLDCIAFPAGN